MVIFGFPPHAPLNVVADVLILEGPDVLRQGRAVTVSAVPHRMLVHIIALLEGLRGQTSVELLSLPKAKQLSGLLPFPIPPTPNSIKNLPASISRHLTDLLSDKTAFGDAKRMYDKSLADSGFCEMTEFLEDRKGSSEKRKRKNRRRNTTWFNPLYSQNVSTNIVGDSIP